MANPADYNSALAVDTGSRLTSNHRLGCAAMISRTALTAIVFIACLVPR